MSIAICIFFAVSCRNMIFASDVALWGICICASDGIRGCDGCRSSEDRCGSDGGSIVCLLEVYGFTSHELSYLLLYFCLLSFVFCHLSAPFAIFRR